MPLQQSVSRNHPVLTIVLVMAATGEHTHKNRYTNYLNNIDALIQKDSTLMFHSLQNTPPNGCWQNQKDKNYPVLSQKFSDMP